MPHKENLLPDKLNQLIYFYFYSFFILFSLKNKEKNKKESHLI